MAFTRLIRAGLDGSVFEVYGDGSQERDFTFVGDIVRALHLAGFGQTSQGVFNIAGGMTVSLRAVIDIVSRLLGRSIRTKYSGSKPGDVQRTSADCSRARAVLGYRAITALEEGLSKQIEYMSDASGQRTWDCEVRGPREEIGGLDNLVVPV